MEKKTTAPDNKPRVMAYWDQDTSMVPKEFTPDQLKEYITAYLSVTQTSLETMRSYRRHPQVGGPDIRHMGVNMWEDFFAGSARNGRPVTTVVVISEDLNFLRELVKLDKRGVTSLLVCSDGVAEMAHCHGVKTTSWPDVVALFEVLKRHPIAGTANKFNPEDYFVLIWDAANTMVCQHRIKFSWNVLRTAISAAGQQFCDREWNLLINHPEIKSRFEQFQNYKARPGSELFNTEKPDSVHFPTKKLHILYDLFVTNQRVEAVGDCGSDQAVSNYRLAQYFHKELARCLIIIPFGQILEFVNLALLREWISFRDGTYVSSETVKQNRHCHKSAEDHVYQHLMVPSLITIAIISAATVTDNVKAGGGDFVASDGPLAPPFEKVKEEPKQSANPTLVKVPISVDLSAGIDISLAEAALEYYFANKFIGIAPNFTIRESQEQSAEGKSFTKFQCSVHVPLPRNRDNDDGHNSFFAYGCAVTKEQSIALAAHYACDQIVARIPTYKFPEVFSPSKVD